MLMNIGSLQWDSYVCKEFGIPMESLPTIKSCSEHFGTVGSSFGKIAGLPITGVIGDQQSACLGHLLQPGEAKCTYGTGCFVLLNTGHRHVQSRNGMLTTVCYRLGKSAEPFYALEGSVEMGGASIMWAKKNLQLFKDYNELTNMISGIPNSGDVYFVPAFSGLYAPHWRSDARGLFIGLSQHTTRAHMLRAIVDGMCFRIKEVIEAMERDSGRKMARLKVDGGVTVNDFIMQNQADALGTIVERKTESEMTALGCAIAAGIEHDG